MFDPRIAELIQADVDGELTASDRSELASFLERSEEARRFREDMLQVARMLSAIPLAEPPAGLRQRILQRIRLPERRSRWEWVALWLRPASYGLAVAAGVLLAVGLGRLGSGGPSDFEGLVGSLVRPGEKAPLSGATAGSLAFGSEGVTGRIVFKALDERSLALEFVIESAQPVELSLDLARAGLRFGGFADAAAGVDVIEVAGGRVRMQSEGRRDFVVFLRRADGSGYAGEPIGIEVSRQGERIGRGLLQPGKQDG